MKLRITQKGFEKYSGQMGIAYFEDGLSTADVHEREALRLSALFDCTWEDGSVVKPTGWIEEPTAPVGRETFIAQTDGIPKPIGGNDGRVIIDNSMDYRDAPVKVTKRYSLLDLEEIADAKGIEGLREIAGPLGIRGKSINSLIESILKVAAKPQDMPEGVEVVEG